MSDLPVGSLSLEGIVDDATFKNTNYLTFNRVYSKVGTNNVIAAAPAVCHFGGFDVGNVYKQKLHIKNVSGVGTRVHIIPPATPFFKAHCRDKLGHIAPGLDEVVEIEFCPQNWQYCYDCIRIHSEVENILVPIHAYPVMNETKFPERVDFGKRRIGDPVKKRVKMECKVPVEFEFQINIVKPNSRFEVSPLSGVVPAHGEVSICITFTPLTLTTEELQLEVRVAEFNSKPIRCSVVGSGFPNLVRDDMVKETIGNGVATMEELDGTAAFKAPSLSKNVNKGGGTINGGAGNGDAYTDYIMIKRKKTISLRDCRKTGPIHAIIPAPPPPQREEKLDGIYVPTTTLTRHGELSYVLNQEPGKLRIRDVKDAVAARKDALAAHEGALQEVLAAGISQGVHPLEQRELPASIKESLFKLQLQQAEEAAKRVLLGSHVYVGQDGMTEEEVAAAHEMRGLDKMRHQRHIEEEAVVRLRTEMDESGALHLPSTSSTSADNSAYTTEATWTLLEANDFRRRVFALQRFVGAVRTVIYKRRIEKRLERIRDVLNQLGHNKERVAEEALNPTLLAPPSDRPGTAPAKMLRPELVRYRPLPIYRHVNFPDRDLAAPSDYTDFGELTQHPLQTPLEYKILGYSPEPMPGLTPYAPPMLDQPLIEGAPEEHPGLLASGVPPDVAHLPTMPNAIRQPPFILLEIGNRYTEDKVCAMPEPSWGMDLDNLIQPREFRFHDSVSHEVPGSGCVRALTGVPFLSQRWLARRELQMQLSPELVPPLTSGADAADLLANQSADNDKPSAALVLPTEEDVERFLPPHLQTSKTKLQVGQRQVVPREQLQDQLDEQKRKKWQASVSTYMDKVEQYNKLLSKPCYFSVKL